LDATIHLSESTVRSTPIEVLEAASVMQFERVEMRTDSGGAGRYRGGVGIRRDIRFTATSELLSVVKKTRSAPWALEGGQQPEPTQVIAYADSDRARPVSTTRLPVQDGDLVRLLTAGGGGHGDPHQRDPELIRRDVEEGYVSAEAAREIYGWQPDEGV
jgi:N-methylhydantoinase B